MASATLRNVSAGGTVMPLRTSPIAGDRYFYGDNQRVVASALGAIDQIHRPVTVLPQIQLEPVSAVTIGRRDVRTAG